MHTGQTKKSKEPKTYNPDYDRQRLILLFSYDCERRQWEFVQYNCKYCGQRIKFHYNVEKHCQKCRILHPEKRVRKSHDEVRKPSSILDSQRMEWVRKFRGWKNSGF